MKRATVIASLVAVAGAFGFASTPAKAQVYYYAPPAYVAPAPVYVPPPVYVAPAPVYVPSYRYYYGGYYARPYYHHHGHHGSFAFGFGW